MSADELMKGLYCLPSAIGHDVEHTQLLAGEQTTKIRTNNGC